MKFAVYIFLVTLFLTGCAGTQANRGKLVLAPDVAASFETTEILPNHKYFFYGPEAQPDTIIGIHNSYTFERGYWKEANITKEKMQGWNRLIANHYRSRTKYEGYRITTPEGKPVGIWYGKYTFTVIKFPAPNTVVIYPPEPDRSIRSFSSGSHGGAYY